MKASEVSPINKINKAYKRVLMTYAGKTLFRDSVVRYITVSLVLLSLIVFTQTLTTAPFIKGASGKLRDLLVSVNSSDFYLKVSKEGIESNTNFPIIIDIPEELQDAWGRSIIVDPNGEVGMMKIHNSLIMVNRTYLVVFDGMDYQTTSLSNLPDMEIDKEVISELINLLSTIKKHAYILIGLVFLIRNAFLLYVVIPIYLILFSVFVYLGLGKKVGSYKKSFQISMDTTPLPIVLLLVADITNLTNGITLLFFLTHALITIHTVAKLENNR